MPSLELTLENKRRLEETVRLQGKSPCAAVNEAIACYYDFMGDEENLRAKRIAGRKRQPQAKVKIDNVVQFAIKAAHPEQRPA